MKKKKESSSAKSERQSHDLKSPPTHQVLGIQVYSIIKFDYHIDLPLLGLRAKTYAKKVVGGTQQAVMLQQCWRGGGVVIWMLENMFNKLQAEQKQLGNWFHGVQNAQDPKGVVDEDQWKEQLADEIYT